METSARNRFRTGDGGNRLQRLELNLTDQHAFLDDADDSDVGDLIRRLRCGSLNFLIKIQVRVKRWYDCRFRRRLNLWVAPVFKPSTPQPAPGSLPKFLHLLAPHHVAPGRSFSFMHHALKSK